MSIIEVNEAFVIIATEDLHGKTSLYTAYPSIYEELTPNTGAYYNSNEVRFTTIRKILDDDDEECEMETTTLIWDIEHAKCLRDFLNKVL